MERLCTQCTDSPHSKQRIYWKGQWKNFKSKDSFRNKFNSRKTAVHCESRIAAKQGKHFGRSEVRIVLHKSTDTLSLTFLIHLIIVIYFICRLQNVSMRTLWSLKLLMEYKRKFTSRAYDRPGTVAVTKLNSSHADIACSFLLKYSRVLEAKSKLFSDATSNMSDILYMQR